MQLSTQQISQYCKRIGYQGSLQPDLATLQALQLHHPRSIAFENLTPWLGLPVSLDPDAVFEKLVIQQRGGYCFEQNQLLARVLETIGFELQGLSARVLWNLPEDARPPRTHQALLVKIGQQRYLADVGFGGLTPLGPLALIPDAEQISPLESFRLGTLEHGYKLGVMLADQFRPMYSFTLEPASPADYVQGNWYVSTHPDSRFVCHLIAACVRNNVRHNLFDRQHTIYQPGAEPVASNITDAASLQLLLTNTFGINLEQLPGLEQKLQLLFHTE